MAIHYYNEDIKMPDLKKREISKWIKAVASFHRKKIGEISYIFCSDDKILEVNKEYLKHDYYTDIITFDYTENDTIGGDIFISVDTVSSNAKEYNISFQNELDRIIIHGILHLCGFKDKSPSERENMTQCENEALCLKNNMPE